MGRRKKNDIEIATLVQEAGKLSEQEVEIIPVEQAEVMSMTQVVEEKQALAARRQEVMLKLDGRRLDQAKKLMDAMDMALDKMINQTVYDPDNDNFINMTALDFKLYSDAYKNLTTMLKEVSRLDSVDSGGKAGRISLKIEFEG